MKGSRGQSPEGRDQGSFHGERGGAVSTSTPLILEGRGSGRARSHPGGGAGRALLNLEGAGSGRSAHPGRGSGRVHSGPGPVRGGPLPHRLPPWSAGRWGKQARARESGPPACPQLESRCSLNRQVSPHPRGAHVPRDREVRREGQWPQSRRKRTGRTGLGRQRLSGLASTKPQRRVRNGDTSGGPPAHTRHRRSWRPRPGDLRGPAGPTAHTVSRVHTRGSTSHHNIREDWHSLTAIFRELLQTSKRKTVPSRKQREAFQGKIHPEPVEHHGREKTAGGWFCVLLPGAAGMGGLP